MVNNRFNFQDTNDYYNDYETDTGNQMSSDLMRKVSRTPALIRTPSNQIPYYHQESNFTK